MKNVGINQGNLLVWELIFGLFVAFASQCGSKKRAGSRSQSSASVSGRIQNRSSIKSVENKSKVVSEPGASDNGVDVLSAADATVGSLAMPTRPVDDNGGTGKLVDSSNETGRSVVSGLTDAQKRGVKLMEEQLRNMSTWVGRNLNIVHDRRVSQLKMLDRKYYDYYVARQVVIRCLAPLNQVLDDDKGAI